MSGVLRELRAGPAPNSAPNLSAHIALLSTRYDQAVAALRAHGERVPSRLWLWSSRLPQRDDRADPCTGDRCLIANGARR